MSYRLIDNDTNEDIIEKLNRIEEEKNIYEQSLLDIKELLKENSDTYKELTDYGYSDKVYELNKVLDIVNKALGDKENE